jgi:hypothetical protein
VPSLLLVCGVQVQALDVPGSAFDISRKGNWLAAGDSDGHVRVSEARPDAKRLSPQHVAEALT